MTEEEPKLQLVALNLVQVNLNIEMHDLEVDFIASFEATLEQSSTESIHITSIYSESNCNIYILSITFL